MLTRYVTSFVSNLLVRSPRILREIELRQFHDTTVARQKKKKSGGWFSRSKKPEGPKIIKPYDCADSPKPITDPRCKVAVVVGGADGFGYAAADHLLCRGARSVVITDNDVDEGNFAAQRLCESYGKDRVQFMECHIQSPCQFEATLSQARVRYKDINIIFNDLDKDWPLTSNDAGKEENNTAKMMRVEMKILRKEGGGSGGVIVNCASIFGFMGWPEDPYPIYCRKEPVIEVMKDFVKDTEMDQTGIRLVTLCPSTKYFSEIGLPYFPETIPNNRIPGVPPCIPTTKRQIGPALSYVLAWAQNDSVWLVEPASSVHENPRLIHFPAKEGEKIDPTIYEKSPCGKLTPPPCVEFSKIDRSKACPKITTICKK
nr:uncharacterized protein LOC117217419 [Megalopta genalis]